MFSQKQKTFLYSVAGLIVLGQLAMIFWLRPWYGVADDGHLLQICDMIDDQGLWSAFQSFVRDDIHWGMFRPTYFWAINGLHCTTQADPTYLYALNALCIFFVAALSAFAFYEILPVRNWPRAFFVPTFFLLCFCTYRFHDQFGIVSLQEKMVLGAGALSLLLLSKKSSPIWVDLLLMVFCLALGFGTKAQFLVFLPGLFLVIFSKDNLNPSTWVKLFLFALLALGGAWWIRHVSALGAYTSGYSFTKAGSNLFSRQGMLLLGLALFSLGMELWLIRREFTMVRLARALLPASFLLSFLAIMSPWIIGDNYLLATTGPLSAFCILSLWQHFSYQREKLLVAMAVLALSLTFFKGYRAFADYGDLRTVLFSETMREVLSKPHVIVVPCIEGRGLFEIYLKRHVHVEHVETAFDLDEKFSPEKRIFVLGDSSFCPIKKDWFPRLKRLTEQRYSGSFALYESTR